MESIQTYLEALESSLKVRLAAVLETIDQILSPTTLRQENNNSLANLESGDMEKDNVGSTGTGSAITEAAIQDDARANMNMGPVEDAQDSPDNQHHGGGAPGCAHPVWEGFPSNLEPPVFLASLYPGGIRPPQGSDDWLQHAYCHAYHSHASQKEKVLLAHYMIIE